MYDVVYDPGFNEGFEIEHFDDLASALKFCEKQADSEIYKKSQRVNLAYNIHFNIY